MGWRLVTVTVIAIVVVVVATQVVVPAWSGHPIFPALRRRRTRTATSLEEQDERRALAVAVPEAALRRILGAGGELPQAVHVRRVYPAASMVLSYRLPPPDSRGVVVDLVTVAEEVEGSLTPKTVGARRLIDHAGAQFWQRPIGEPPVELLELRRLKDYMPVMYAGIVKGGDAPIDVVLCHALHLVREDEGL